MCIPKVAKFFHTLTQEEADAEALTLPDKDGGSTLKATPTADGKPYANDWIVALYMGVNKGGSTDADATPLYWTTGNLIATKTNAANIGATDAAFHIATADETLAEALTASTYSVPAGFANSITASYDACALGAQWNKFGWGDATGLNTSVNNANYAKDITAAGTSISGDAAYDIARAKLGGSWRLPTGGSGKANELAAYSSSDLSPEDWTVSGYTGREYTYTADGITNTIRFPAAGYREKKEAKELGSQGFYWSGTAQSYGYARRFYFGQGEAKQDNTDRASGLSVRPVTE